jgi:glycosyltransferase involved in cell wall biosynthesis
MKNGKNAQNNKLTIGIPTYNRNSLLIQALLSVLEQSDDRMDIIVVDNCSPMPVLESAAEILDKFRAKGCGVKVITNPANIGGNCNIALTLSQLKSGWMLLLGDDDELSPDALPLILEKIREAPDNCTLMKFSHADNPCPAQVVETYQSLGDVGDKLSRHGYSWFHNFGFISTSVYHVDELRRHLPHAFHYAYTCFPHLIPVLLSLKEGQVFQNHPDHIINIQKSSKCTTAVDYTHAILGVCALGEVPGMRDFSKVMASYSAKNSFVKFIVKNFVIGICYEPENNRFWAGVNIRYGGSVAGWRGPVCIVLGWFQIWAVHLPFLPQLIRMAVERSGVRPRWHSERN